MMQTNNPNSDLCKYSGLTPLGISQSATQMYKNLDRGDSGFADLDAAMAALEISGGAGAAAAMAWGVFLDAAGAYSEGN